MSLANNNPLYLVYYDIGDSPTDMDDLCIAWTDVMYYAKLRVNIMMKRSWINPASIQLKVFRNMDEMVAFLSTFDVNMIDIENLSKYVLCLYQTETPLSSHHIGIWTADEIEAGVDTAYNIGEFRKLDDASNILVRASSYFRNPELKVQFEQLRKSVVKYLNLYAIRESFYSDIECYVDDGEESSDFQTVRDAFMKTDGIDIVTPHISEYWYHIFDQTEVFYRIARMHVL